MTSPHIKQRGVGIIEALIALALLMFAALSVSNLQTSSLLSMHISESHFSINEQSRDMLEVLKSNTFAAKQGLFNYDFEQSPLVDADTTPPVARIAQWKTDVADSLPKGDGKIECGAEKCTVTVKWVENIDGTLADQFFNIAGLL